MIPLQRLLGGGLLVAVAVGGTAHAERPSLSPLLKPLDLVGYAGGTTPPGFNGRTLDSRPLSLTELRGKVVLVNFWATWCLECRPEIPVLERLHGEFGPRGPAVVGLNARAAEQAVGRYALD